jgi:hypothetical protein
MTFALDDATRKKLVLVKQLYEQALRQSAPHTSIMDRIMAVIGFDLAMETILKAAALIIDPRLRPSDLSGDLIPRCEQVFRTASVLYPPMGTMRRIRGVRNDAQHEARYPNETDLNDCRVYARDILNHVLTEVWGESLDTISLVDLIQNTNAKQFFIRAEEELAKGVYDEAAAQALGGFQWTLGKVRAAFVGRDLVRMSTMTQKERDMNDVVNRLRFTMLFHALGIDYADTVRFNKTIGEVLVMADDVTVHLMRDEGMPPIDRPIVETTMAYCIDMVVRIEQRVGDLESPFGVEYWW